MMTLPLLMAKTKNIIIRVTPEQDRILQEKSVAAGFNKKSEYVRSQLFQSILMEEKINKIYEKVVENG